MIIRPSHIGIFTDCERRSAGETLPELKTDRVVKNAIATSFGTACHAGVEYMLKYQAKHCDVIDHAVEEFDKFDSVEYDQNTSSRDKAIRQMGDVLKVFSEHFAPKISAVEIERRYVAKYRGVEISGCPDIIEESKIDDLKTGATVSAANIAQLGTYSLILASHGRKISELELIHIPRGRVQSSKSVVIDAQQAGKYAIVVLNMIIDKYNRYEQTKDINTFTMNPNSTMCSEKFCKLYGTEFCSVSCIDKKITMIF